MQGTAMAEDAGLPWWLVLIQGLVAIALGVFLILQPGITTLVILQLLAIYWLVAGVISIVRLMIGNSKQNWGSHLLMAILGIVAGLAILSYPLYSTVLVPSILMLMIGCIAIAFGIVGIIQAFRARSWFTGFLGGVSIIIGLLLVSSPLMAAWVLGWLIGLMLIAGGIVAIFSSFRMNR
jgi:uncharacterized membrane protein HdeD (DUF308 family)